jgi:hypothetical protein
MSNDLTENMCGRDARGKIVGMQLCLAIAHALDHSLLENALESWKMQTEVTDNITNRGSVWTEVQGQRMWGNKHN